MKNIILQILFLVLVLNLTSSKLISVIEVNRHGARSAENFPEEYLQQFFGIAMKLTQNGYRQHQLLGTYMNDRYIKTGFIHKKYRPEDFEIISTPTQRTIFSADGFVSGLYPGYVVKVTNREPSFPLIENDTIPVPNPPRRFNEIPLKVLSKAENSFYNPWACKLQGVDLKKKSENKTIFPNILPISDEDMEYTAKYLAEYFNVTKSVSETSAEKFVKAAMKYVVPYFYHYGLKMEEQLPKKVADVIKKMYVNKWYNARLKDNKLLKIGASEFLEIIKNSFKKAITASQKPFIKKNGGFTKYTVYSSHDTPIVNLIANLVDEETLRNIIENSVQDQKAYDFLVPPFASHILFELHNSKNSKNNNGYYVSIYYNGKLLNYPIRGLESMEFDGKIPFNDFVRFIENRVDNDYQKLVCVDGMREEKFELFPIFEKKKDKIIGPSDFTLMSQLISLHRIIMDNNN